MKEILKYKNIVAAVIIVIIFALVINKLSGHYTLEKQKIAEKREVLEKGKKTLEEWQGLNTAYKREASNFFSKDASIFKTFVEQKAQGNKLGITSLSVSKADEDFYWQATTKISFTCTYDRLIGFIGDLEKKNVEIARMKVKTSEKDKVNVDADLKGIVLK